MSQVLNNALYSWNNGDLITDARLNQDVQVLQAAINDNWARLIKTYQVLNPDGTTKATQNLTAALNTINFKSDASIILSLDTATSTLTVAIAPAGITNQHLASNIIATANIQDGALTNLKIADASISTSKLQDGSVTLNKLDVSTVDTRYYTQTQVDAKVNTASSTTKVVQTGTAFPTTGLVDGQEFYRSDLKALYIYDVATASWVHPDKTVGDITTLATTDKTDVVHAINENVNKIGDLSTLKTQAKDKLVNAINEHEDKLSNANTTTVTLNRGQNLINVLSGGTGVVPFNVLNIKGRTLVNLLGRDGNCEDISKWSIAGTGVALALDSSNKVYGNNSIKITLGTDPYGATMRDILPSLKTGSYYIVLAEFKIGTSTKGRVRFQSNASGTYVNVYGNDITTTSSFGVSYLKIQPSDFASKTNFWMYAQFEGVNGNTGYVDGIRIFEISQSEYNALGTTLTDINQIAQKYPYVDDLKSLNNPYLIAYGQNLAGIGSSWSIGSTTSTFTVPCIANQAYTLSKAGTSTTTMAFLDANGTALTGELTGTQTSPSNAKTIRLTTNLIQVQDIENEKIMLNLGSTALPFVPREDDYVYFQTALRSNFDGSVADSLTYENGQFVKTNRWAEVIFDGSLTYAFSADLTGYKSISCTSISNRVTDIGTMVKYDGKILTLVPSATSVSGADQFKVFNNGTDLYITIADTDSGWGETYTPTAQEIQAYFYGWKMYDGTVGVTTPYNGTGSKAWAYRTNGVDGTGGYTGGTNTLPVTLAGNGFAPYKLVYQLANPTQEVVQTEGLYPALQAGANQVELGEAVIVRELAKPVFNSPNWFINDSGLTSSQTKYRDQKIIAVYKNGQLDPKWTIDTGNPYGVQRAYCSPANFDQTASYSVTYIAQPYQLSSSILSLDGSYESNLRKDVDRNTQNIADLGERLSAVEITKANKQQGQWITPTLLNGWVPYGGSYPSLRYMKDEMGFVHLDGEIKNGTVGSILCYLPVGFRPSVYIDIAVACGGNLQIGSITIKPDGTVIVSGSSANAWLTFGGISFQAEQ